MKFCGEQRLFYPVKRSLSFYYKNLVKHCSFNLFKYLFSINNFDEQIMITIIEKNDLTNQISCDENNLARNEL